MSEPKVLYEFEHDGQQLRFVEGPVGPIYQVLIAERWETIAWVPPGVVTEILRLAAENAELRGLLEEAVPFVEERAHAPALATRIRQALEKGDDGDK